MEKHEVIAAAIITTPIALILLFVWWAGGMTILGQIILTVLGTLTITGFLPLYLIASMVDFIAKFQTTTGDAEAEG
ncbi:hypothetical protein UFOVP1228_10 [uncultured Caudovirales phage]|uniref:Uncharacterized protein n=1 Tax=uncultured Caudovirales phage TaxID=2100421 RepID=A0A6J5SKQ6_9CAUD|nr:hypothetical protein UFOVP956_10 [uncultured Caudovirales phage]CAB4191128.1 hypothetical protein UFOVP1228_10 [uncultured Caudovirales phage]CAB4215478.1 hypothetical protein UFOVP1481_28 [uncultured Caudovirales phage]